MLEPNPRRRKPEKGLCPRLSSYMLIGGCEYPDSLLYDVDSGTWVKREGALSRIGIAPHLSWISGGFTFVSFKGVGSLIESGKALGSLEGPRHFDVVRAPFDCVVKEYNSRLLDLPKLANKDPFGEGWFALLEETGTKSRLLTLAQAEPSIADAVRRLGVRCFAEFPDFEIFEAGSECTAVLVRLDELMKRAQSGAVVHLVSDDPTSDSEIETWTGVTGNRLVETRREGSLHHFIVKKR